MGLRQQVGKFLIGATMLGAVTSSAAGQEVPKVPSTPTPPDPNALIDADRQATLDIAERKYGERLSVDEPSAQLKTIEEAMDLLTAKNIPVPPDWLNEAIKTAAQAAGVLGSVTDSRPWDFPAASDQYLHRILVFAGRAATADLDESSIALLARISEYFGRPSEATHYWMIYMERFPSTVSFYGAFLRRQGRLDDYRGFFFNKINTTYNPVGKYNILSQWYSLEITDRREGFDSGSVKLIIQKFNEVSTKVTAELEKVRKKPSGPDTQAEINQLENILERIPPQLELAQYTLDSLPPEE